MDRWVNRVAVVTGAVSGNGAACARRLLKACIQVVGLDTNAEAMEKMKKSLPPDQRPRFHCKNCNVSDEEQVRNTFQCVDEDLDGIDILVNSTGALRPGRLVDMPTQHVRDTLNANVLATIYCTQRAIHSMQKRKYPGHVLFISSTAGLSGYNRGPEEESLNVYMPSQLTVTAINQICRTDLIRLKSKVKTTNISPGFVKTTKDKEGDEDKGSFLYPEDVAEAVIYALSTPPHVQIEQITLRSVGEWY